jgi:hypothetical protein
MEPLLEKLQREIASALAAVPAERIRWRPEGNWCVAEVLEHLYLTYTGTIKGLERMTAAGNPRTTAATWAQRWNALVVLRLGYMRSGREAPQMARPRGLPAEKVVAEIGPKIGEMDECIRRCEEKFGTKTKLLDHPFLGPLTGAQWRKFHLVHGRHHAKQVRRLGREVKEQSRER